MIVAVTILHVIICFFLVIVVLLQSGKAADLAGAFGGMGSQTAFGPRGSATILSKATTVAAALFVITSISLTIMASKTGGAGAAATTVLETEGSQAVPVPEGSTAPSATPTGPPSVKITPEGGGPSKTIPLAIPPRPGQPEQPAPDN